jgi:hypothetical protein
MNEFLESINKNPDLEKLKALMEFHFGKFFDEIGISLEDHLILTACAAIDYLIFSYGDISYMKKQFRDRYPEMILEIVNKKYHSELTFVKEIEKQIADRDLEIKQYIRLRCEMEQKNFALTKENERLEKMVQKQTQVLRNLQDRLDSVNNSGQ